MKNYNWGFDLQTFKTSFTEFNALSEPQFNFYKLLAKNFVDMDCYFEILPLSEEDALGGLVVAHLASLFARRGNGGAGTITSASEGSVSIGFTGLNNVNWWTQTIYGTMFWQIIRKHLTPFMVSGKTDKDVWNAGI